MRSTRLVLLEGHVNRARWYVGVAMLLMLSLILVAGRADAGTAAACEGGGFSLVLPGGTVSGSQKGTIPAGALGESFLVKGKYVEFEVGSATFGIRNYTLTGVPNPLDITGGRRAPGFAAHTPPHPRPPPAPRPPPPPQGAGNPPER